MTSGPCERPQGASLGQRPDPTSGPCERPQGASLGQRPDPTSSAAGVLPARRDLRERGVWSGPQRLKNDLLFAAARGALWLAAAMPRRALRLSCTLIGLVVWALSPRLRTRARARLREGGAPRGGREVRRAFTTIGALLADTVALLDPREDPARTLSLPDESRRALRAAFAEGRGVIFATAHLGPWERMAALLAAEGFPVTTVARESYDPRFTRLYERLRGPRDVRCVWRGRPGAGRQVVRELCAGRAVGVLIDLPGRSASLDCPLFGARTPVASGPARLALGLGASVVLGTPVPIGGDRFELLIERIDTDGTDVEQLTNRLADALTLRIRRGPAAWLGLFHGLGGPE